MAKNRIIIVELNVELCGTLCVRTSERLDDFLFSDFKYTHFSSTTSPCELIFKLRANNISGISCNKTVSATAYRVLCVLRTTFYCFM